MPATFLHLGPACLVKGFLPRHFSLCVFAFANVIIDIEPLVRMSTASTPLHGPTHTLAGATVLGVVAAGLGKPVAEKLLGWWNAREDHPLLRFETRVSWPVSIASAFVGTFSHVVLDGIMHGDVEPFAPFTRHNGFLGWLSIPELHLVCALTGFIGLLLFFLVRKHSI